MFWLIVGLLLLAGGYLVWHYSFVTCRRTSYNDHVGFFLYAVIAILGWCLPAVIVTANMYDTSNNVHNSAVLIVNKKSQRDHLLDLVKAELSADAYKELAAATPDADVTIIVGNQASAILIERAKQIVQLNADVYGLENKITSAEIGLCNMDQNPLLPQVPFVGPDCDLGAVPKADTSG